MGLTNLPIRPRMALRSATTGSAECCARERGHERHREIDRRAIPRQGRRDQAGGVASAHPRDPCSIIRPGGTLWAHGRARRTAGFRPAPAGGRLTLPTYLWCSQDARAPDRRCRQSTLCISAEIYHVQVAHARKHALGREVGLPIRQARAKFQEFCTKIRSLKPVLLFSAANISHRIRLVR